MSAPSANAVPVPSADDDVAAGVEATWTADTQLPTLVPGLLQRDRLTSSQPNSQPRVNRQTPYATFVVSKGQESIHHAAGANYIDNRKVEIRIFGLKPLVETALAYIRSAKLFNRVQIPTVAFCMGCRQNEHDDLTQDPTVKQGEDIWIGTILLEVWTSRPE